MTRASVTAWVVGGVVVLAVVVSLLVSRPGSPSPDPPTGLERRAAALAGAVGTPAGTDAVDVGAGRDERGYPYVATVVTLDAAATGTQVAAVVAGLPDATARVGLPSTYSYRKLSFVTPTGARLTVAWQPQVDAAAVGRAADGWLATATTLRGGADVAAIVLTGGDLSLRLSLGPLTADRGLLDGYDVAAAEVAREVSDQQTHVQWDVSATAGGTLLQLSSTGPLHTADEHAWTRLLRDARLVRGSIDPSRLEVSFRDRVEVHLAVLAPDAVDDADFTPASYGDRVWPAVRPQLQALARQNGHWSYFLSWAHHSRPSSEQLIALLLGDQGDVRDRTGKDRSPYASIGWSDGARAFLRGDQR